MEGTRSALGKVRNPALKESSGQLNGLSKLSTIYIETYRALHRQAQRIVRDSEAADDVVQQAFLNTADSIKAGTEIEHVSAYLKRCVYNLAIRRVQRATAMPLEDDLTDSGDDLPDEVADVKQRWQEVYEIVNNLTPAQRSAFLLAELRGYKYCEIADTMDRSETSVRQLLARARARIRRSAGANSVPLVLPVLALPRLRFQPRSIVDRAGSVVKSVVEFLAAQLHKAQSAFMGQAEQIVHGLAPAAIMPLAVVVFATSAVVNGSNGTPDGGLGAVARFDGEAAAAGGTPGNTLAVNRGTSVDRKGDTGVPAPPSALRGHSPQPAVDTRGKVESPAAGGSGGDVARTNPIGEKAGLGEGPADVVGAPVTAPLVNTGTIVSGGEVYFFWVENGLYCWAVPGEAACTDGAGGYVWWTDQGNRGLWNGEGGGCSWSQADLQGSCWTPNGQVWDWNPYEEDESGDNGGGLDNGAKPPSYKDGKPGGDYLNPGGAEIVPGSDSKEPGSQGADPADQGGESDNGSSNSGNEPGGSGVGPNSSGNEPKGAGNESNGSNDKPGNPGEIANNSGSGDNVTNVADNVTNVADNASNVADNASNVADEGNSPGDEEVSSAAYGAENSADIANSPGNEGNDSAEEAQAQVSAER